jgi:hypothetical protein
LPGEPGPRQAITVRWTEILTVVPWLALALACSPAEPAAPADESSTGATTGPGPSTGAITTGPSTTAPDPSTGLGDGSTGATTTSDGTTSPSGDTTTTSGSDTTAGSDTTTGPDPGLGVISGECGLIDAMELDSPSPFTFVSAIDFRRVGFDYDMLTPEGQQVFDAGNLGGSSLESEVVAFEVLARCEGASLLATEAEIQYTDPMGTKTDILVEIDGRVVGVSVTRAVGFPFDAPYTEPQAADLLTGKLEDILASTANVAPRNEWVKQILHVIAYADMHAQSILAAYATLPPAITADTILVVTVTHGDDAFVY